MRRLLLCLLVCTACASSAPSPYFRDAEYLRFGVDPKDEARELIKLYADQGEPLALRVVGKDFTALGFMNRTGISTRARLLTVRGIQVALDPEPGLIQLASTRYALLAAPFPDTQDADRDGFEEVFVEARTKTGTCLRVYRVRDIGFVDPVAVDQTLVGGEFCPSELRDLDRDGRVELLTDVTLPGFGLDAAPRLRVVLWADRHRFVVRDDNDRASRYLAQEQALREQALLQAQAANDVQSGLRLAVELAALAQLQDATATDQVSRFDAALVKLSLRTSERTWAQAARTRIQDGWTPGPEPISAPEPPPPPEPPTPQLAERDASWYITPPHEQERQKRLHKRARSHHLSKSKGRAKLRRRGKVRSGPRAHRIRSEKPARQTR